MSKLVKSRLVKACFCIVIGLIMFIFSMLDNNLDYEIRNYLNGISFGVGFVGLFFLAHSIILIRNPKKK